MLDCILTMDSSCGWVWSMSSIFVGFRLLEKEGLLRIKKARVTHDFLSGGHYPHRQIVELRADGKTIAYDMADGYQDFDIPELFDKQLESVDFYFKSNYSEEFAAKLKNKDKFKNCAIAYDCSCPGNPFESLLIKGYLADKRYKDAAYTLAISQRRQKNFDYRSFEADNHFDNYKLLFWSRLWAEELIPTERMSEYYPHLSHAQAKEKAEQTYEMIRATNRRRIETARVLKEEFGDLAVGGLSGSETAAKLAPNLITDDERVLNRRKYLDCLKENYIHVLSMGLHGCIGARYGETFAAGRAFLTDPFLFSPYGDPKEGVNYFAYTDADSLAQTISKLLTDVDLVHRSEEANHTFYQEYIRPDVRILATLKTAFPNKF